MHKVRCNFGRSRYKVSEMSLRYQIVLHKSEEGYAVNCPALPGCWSQGETEQEAMQNIRNAIEDYLAAVSESLRGSDVREVEVSV
jgi:predicted RNase H-like HicB family nuclease